MHNRFRPTSQLRSADDQFWLVQSGGVNVRGAGHSRRWQRAVGVVAALCLFVSLIAGSALRPQYSAATLPEPAAWSQATPNSAHSHMRNESPATIHLQQASSWDAAPANTKPFHSMWMTHDRPDVWTRLPSPLLWSVLPASFAGTGFQSGDIHRGADATACGHQGNLALLCVARR